jgi:hypothetical protein
MTPAVVLSILYPKRWGEFDAVLIYQSVLLFVVELLWEACLSFAHIKWNVKINYTRKLGHLLRLPKYFLAAYIPGFEENPMTLLCAFVFSQVKSEAKIHGIEGIINGMGGTIEVEEMIGMKGIDGMDRTIAVEGINGMEGT